MSDSGFQMNLLATETELELDLHDSISHADTIEPNP